MHQHKITTLPRRSPRIQESQVQKDFNRLMEESIVLSTRKEQASTILSSTPSPIFNGTPIFLDSRFIRTEHSFLGGVFEDISPLCKRMKNIRPICGRSSISLV